MAITLNPFKCINGHQYEANAKIRARCPECGTSNKRSFEVKKEGDSTVSVLHGASDKGSVVPTSKPVTATEPKLKTGAILLRQGRERMPTKRTVKAKTPVKSVAKNSVAAGLVKSHRITTRGSIPTIKKRPIKTAIARGIQGHEVVKPYWHDVADKYGF